MAASRDAKPEGYALVADQQTEGRGRLERRWRSEAGEALLVSVLLRPRLKNLAVMPLLAGLAVQEALQRLVPAVDPSAFGLKWPNDIIMLNNRGRKVAGILVESEVSQKQVAVVVGIGLNLRLGENFPAELRGSAIALEDLAATQLTQQEALDTVLRSLERWLLRLDGQGAEGILSSYRNRCCTIGRDVDYLADDGSEISGKVIGIQASGGVLLKTVDGERVILNGDLTLGSSER